MYCKGILDASRPYWLYVSFNDAPLLKKKMIQTAVVSENL